jgi:hypothetical protein
MPLCQEYALVDALIGWYNLVLTGHGIEKRFWIERMEVHSMHIVVSGGMVRDYAIYLSLGLSDSFPLAFSLLRYTPYMLSALVQD